MLKKIKIFKIGMVLLLFLLSFINLSLIAQLQNEEAHNYSSLSISSEVPGEFTGAYGGDASILGLNSYENHSYWLDANRTSLYTPHNRTFHPYPYEYTLNRLDIRAYNIFNGSGDFAVADDLSVKSDVDLAVRVAQEFIAPEDIAIETLSLWLDFTGAGFGSIAQLRASIYDENLEEEIDFVEISHGSLTAEWVEFRFDSNILSANSKYNIVLTRWDLGKAGDTDRGIDFWLAVNHSSSIQNKGMSRIFKEDGDSWIQIQNDTYRDLVLNFSYYELIDPEDIDLTFFIDNQLIIPAYKENLRAGEYGYEASTVYNFNNPPSKIINVTITSNKTIPNLNITVEPYYIYLLNATGTFIADENQIEWTIIYPYKVIGGMWPSPFFLFESDWDFSALYDPSENTMSDLYFGPLDVYGVTYYGIFQLYGEPLDSGNYTGKFTSPNYCNTINTQVKENGDYEEKSSIELGEDVQFQAEIRNSQNELISGGNGQITVLDPSGDIIHSDFDLTAVNGIITSSEVEFEDDDETGTYKVQIFWSNGKEVAFYTMEVEVEEPEDPVLNGITPETLILIGILVALAIAATPLALVARRVLQQRNWEKSLKNLFILSKEGQSMYEYTFGIDLQDPALISGMILALTDFIKEATGSKQSLRKIDHEDKKVILNHGNFCIFALMSEKDLPIIHKRLEKFALAFESFYGKHLKSWKGQVSFFKGTDTIISKYFPIDVEDQIIRGVNQKLIEFRERIITIDRPDLIVAITKEITEFYTRYENIVTKHYVKEFNELIRIANERLSS